MFFLDDPAHWSKRADEMRRLAVASSDQPGTRALLEILAQSYDELAARAEKRLESNPGKHQR
jgi:hypothetical protein